MTDQRPVSTPNSESAEAAITSSATMIVLTASSVRAVRRATSPLASRCGIACTTSAGSNRNADSFENSAPPNVTASAITAPQGRSPAPSASRKRSISNTLSSASSVNSGSRKNIRLYGHAIVLAP